MRWSELRKLSESLSFVSLGDESALGYHTMEIVSFSPATGHCVLVPTAELALFRSHIAQMAAAERDRFAPLSLSATQPVQGGAHYDVGVQRTHTEVIELLSHVIIDD